MKNTKYAKRVSLLTILIFVLLVFIPLVIHVLFKIHPGNSFFSAEWSAGDVLGFYGVLLGSATTVVGVYLSIRYAQKNYREDTVYRSLPFMVIEKIDTDDRIYKNANALFYVINKGKVTLNQGLSVNDRLAAERCGIRMKDTTSGVSFINTRTIVTSISIENVGNGAATSFSVGFDRSNLVNSSPNFTLARSLKVGNAFCISIFSDNPDSSNVGEYEMCISYYDILGNGYKQRLRYSITGDDNGIDAKLSLNGTQIKSHHETHFSKKGALFQNNRHKA